MTPHKVRIILATGVVVCASLTRIASAQAQTWVIHGPDGGNIRALAIDQQSPATLFAGVSGGVFKTTDGGAHWAPANTGLPLSAAVFTLAVDPQPSDVVYAGTSAGAFKSVNGGGTWT